MEKSTISPMPSTTSQDELTREALVTLSEYLTPATLLGLAHYLRTYQDWSSIMDELHTIRERYIRLYTLSSHPIISETISKEAYLDDLELLASLTSLDKIPLLPDHTH